MSLDSAIALVASLRRFQIVRALGKGGMGNVFEAVEPNGRHLAVKIFHPEVVATIAHGENIFSNFPAAVQISHPNLCSLLSFYHDKQLAFLTMECVRGQLPRGCPHPSIGWGGIAQ